MTLSNTSQRVLFDGVLLCPPPQNPTGLGGGLINAEGVNRTPEGGATQHVQRVPFNGVLLCPLYGGGYATRPACPVL